MENDFVKDITLVFDSKQSWELTQHHHSFKKIIKHAKRQVKFEVKESPDSLTVRVIFVVGSVSRNRFVKLQERLGYTIQPSQHCPTSMQEEIEYERNEEEEKVLIDKPSLESAEKQLKKLERELKYVHHLGLELRKKLETLGLSRHGGTFSTQLEIESMSDQKEESLEELFRNFYRATRGSFPAKESALFQKVQKRLGVGLTPTESDEGESPKVMFDE